MRFDVLTLFPEFFDSPLRFGVIGQAITKGTLKVETRNIRDYTVDRHRTADDYPYGGGCGMVMKAEPIVSALEATPQAGRRKVLLTTPQGAVFNQGLARELAAAEQVVLICGRYEGVDERVMGFVDLEVSTGDYVLSGGETAALIIIDAVGRLVPGVLGGADSTEDDSFTDGLLEYPQYTRPEDFRGLKVPPVLLSGNHGEIKRWRRALSLERTLRKRPELLGQATLTDEDIKIIDGLKKKP